MRSKLPGINLEVTAKRMEGEGGREGRSQVRTRRQLIWQKNGGLKIERDKKRKNRERN